MKRCVVRWYVTVSLLLVALATAAAQPAPSRLIAIGDIHGAADSFRALLKQAGLVDEQLHWAGGRTTFVQTGDFLDRGLEVRAVMDLLMLLEEEASEDGGGVEVLLGNHETMNLMMNVRDVHPDVYATFATEDSFERQKDAHRDYERYVAERTEALGRPLPDRQSRDAWLEAHPPGFVEYVEALGPDGRYGRWLRSKPIAVTIDETIFLHGGLSLENDSESVAAMVERAADEITRFDSYREHLIDWGVILPTSTFEEILTAVALELQAWTIKLFPGPPASNDPPTLVSDDERVHLNIMFEIQGMADWSVISEQGPLWSRDFARWSDHEGRAAIPGLLERFGVRRAVVGHSVTPTRRINPRFDNRVFLIDTGMLAEAYQGRASALELTADGPTAIYLDGRVPLAASVP